MAETAVAVTKPELEVRARRVTEGIPVPDRTWDDLMALAGKLGVTAAGLAP